MYIQKSGNFQFQGRSYSMHKGRPLIKPMVVVSTTGYFITVVGPYLSDSKNNDASYNSNITILVVIGTDCTDSCKSNSHTITTMTVPN